MVNKYFVSRRGLQTLRHQKQTLINDLDASTRAMGHSASIDNDLRENPEFMQLRTKVTYEIPNKLAEIQRILESYCLIEDTEAMRGSAFEEVLPGMQIELETENGEKRVLSVLGYGDGNPAQGVVSYLSPVGEALLHKVVGDEVSLLSKGTAVDYEIVNISRSPFLD